MTARYPSRWVVHLAVAKVPKFGVAQSGDTVEIIERPDGGLSAVMADGQRSGPSAKAVANLVVRRVIGLLAEGVRDGAAARAAADTLYMARQGRVQASLHILSADMASQTLVVVRNTPLPVWVWREGHLEALDEPAQPLGLQRYTRPVVREFPFRPETYILAYTDGLAYAGQRRGRDLNLPQTFTQALQRFPGQPQAVVDALLDQALEAEAHCPADDISVMLLYLSHEPGGDHPPVRRLAARMPLPPVNL